MFAYMHKVKAVCNIRSINLLIISNNCIDCLGENHKENSESHRVIDVCHMEGFSSVISWIWASNTVSLKPSLCPIIPHLPDSPPLDFHLFLLVTFKLGDPRLDVVLQVQLHSTKHLQPMVNPTSPGVSHTPLLLLSVFQTWTFKDWRNSKEKTNQTLPCETFGANLHMLNLFLQTYFFKKVPFPVSIPTFLFWFSHFILQHWQLWV